MTNKKLYLIKLILVISVLHSCTNDKNVISVSNNEIDNYTYETPEDPDAPYVRDEWKNWIKANHQRILSLDSENFEDLHFIDQFLMDKSIVLLGEIAHGVAEQNRIRVRLIKYLHQEHGFNVVAFESSLHDCYFTDKDIKSIASKDVLKNALYPFWHTTDLIDLVDYIKQSYSSNNPIHLAGFDIHSTGMKSVNRPGFLKNITINIDSIFSETILEVDRIIVQRRTRREYVDDYVVKNYETLRVLYQKLINIITNNADLLKQYFDEETILVAREIAVSISKYILSQYVPISYTIRDKQMAETIKFIKEVLFPGQKIIIWAHNCHVQKDLEAVAILPHGNYYDGTNMGNWLYQTYPMEMYTIGSLAYRGHINYGQVQDITITKDECIEATLYHARKEYFFIDFSQQLKEKGNSWIFQPVSQTYIHRNGPFDIQYIPKDQYDAILFIDTISEPEYVY
jgi:erythromycin esterase